MKDALICAARAAWYGVTEPPRLWMERLAEGPVYELLREPLVSVIVPTHNRAELLAKRALFSILAQSYTNLEVIVAAHGCTDGTHETVEGWGDARLRLLKVPRTRTYPPTAENHWFAGPVAPLNAGLAAVRGDWIARCDDDDIWTTDHVERLLRFAKTGGYEFVSAAHRTGHDEAGKVEPYMVRGVPVGGTQTWLYRSYLRFMKYNPDCWRKRWNRVNDTDLQQRFRNAGVRMGYLDDVVAWVLPRPGETEVGMKAYKADRENKEAAFSF